MNDANVTSFGVKHDSKKIDRRSGRHLVRIMCANSHEIIEIVYLDASPDNGMNVEEAGIDYVGKQEDESQALVDDKLEVFASQRQCGDVERKWVEHFMN